MYVSLSVSLSVCLSVYLSVCLGSLGTKRLCNHFLPQKIMKPVPQVLKQVLKQVVSLSCFLSYIKYCLTQNKWWNVPTWSAFWILGTSASGSNWEFSSLKMFMVRTLSSDCGRSGSTLSNVLRPWFKRFDDFLAWASPWWEKIYNDKPKKSAL